jgi:hypothetical protein
MNRGVKQLQDRPEDKSELYLTTLLQHVGDLRLGLEAIGSGLKEAAESTAGRSVELTMPTEPPPQRVIVQYRVPREILKVVEAQFDVVNRWMEPLLAASQDQRTDMSKLQDAIQTLQANYYALLEELESAKPKK